MDIGIEGNSNKLERMSQYNLDILLYIYNNLLKSVNLMRSGGGKRAQ